VVDGMVGNGGKHLAQIDFGIETVETPIKV
jgi:hypothetical protein